MTRLPIYLLLLLALVPAVRAQTESAPQLELSLNRDWGYGGLGGQIQGHFSARVRGPDDLERVVFYLDDQILGEADAPPFKIRFVTDDYSLGEHTLSAVGYTTDGRTLTSNTLHREFVSAQQGWRDTGKMVLPLLGVVFGAMLLAALVAYLGERKRKPLPPGAPRSYGIFGGAVCPKCGRPFSRHWWAPNLLAGKFDRCPHCGRWSIVRAAPPEVLRAAERAELEAAVPLSAPPDETEQWKKDLDDSRYLDE
ncbi:MAG TPA: hypothetical protein ENJ02_11275 [Chloroflexi bacterium]|nr:hypothetical protein [Chloroflexota bacterium]